MAALTILGKSLRHRADVVRYQDPAILSGQMKNGQIIHIVNRLRPEVHERTAAKDATNDSPIKIVVPGI